MKNQLFSLKNKLMAFFLISTMSLFVGFTIVNYHYATKNLQELSLDKLQTISKLKANKLESYVDNLSKTVQSLQNLVMVRDNLPKLEAYTKNFNAELTQDAVRNLDRILPRFQKIHDFFDIMLVGKNGKVVYSSNSAERADDVGIAINAKVSELFEQASKKIYFSEPFLYNPTDRDLTLMVAAPIADEQNNFIGLICVELRLASLQYLVEDFLGLGQTGESYLVIKKTADATILETNKSYRLPKISMTPIDFLIKGRSRIFRLSIKAEAR
jgi:methyl-accepting chemotaxis protein